MVKLSKINWDNFWDVMSLQTTKEQERFIVPISVYMAEAYVNVTNNNPDVCFAIYDEDVLIGFSKIVYVPSNETTFNFKENSYMIDALIIDKAYQHQGKGKKALEKILEFIQREPFGDFELIRLACCDDNINAIKFYKRYGFNKTDQFVNEKKKLRILELTKSL